MAIDGISNRGELQRFIEDVLEGSAFAARTRGGGGGGASYATVQDEGVALVQRAILDFVGDAITATDDPVNARTKIEVIATTIINQVVAEQQRSYWVRNGSLVENFPRWGFTPALLAMINGQMYFSGGVTLVPGVTYSNVSFYSTQVPIGMTHLWFCVVRATDLAILGKTPDDTSGSWPISTTKTLTLSAPITVAVPTPVYVGIVTQATSTKPGPRGAQTVNTPYADAPALAGLGPTGLTDPSSFTAVTFTTAGASINLWCAMG